MSAADVRPQGVYDIPEDEYRADPALSCSQALRILDAPAKYLYDREHGERHAGHFDVGKAAHKLVLGAGAPLRVIDADDWRKKATQEARDEAYAAGEIPVLTDTYATVQAMAAAIGNHPIARTLFRRSTGRPEMSLFWQDRRTGAPLRARLDWLPNPSENGRLIIPDYKSTANASTRAFGSSAASFGYHQKHAWYVDGAAMVLGLDYEPAFVLVAQEKDPPYLVNVVELDDGAVEIGRDRNLHAIDVWLDCQQSGVWPGYGLDVASVSLPKWTTWQHDDDLAAWSDGDDEQF